MISDDNLKLILKEDGSIAGVDVVKQMHTDILPTINISTNTGSGAVLRPVMSIERSTREERLIQVVDCILPKENYQILETETTIEPEISAETLVETPVETSPESTTPMQTNVSNTTTPSQTSTSPTSQSGTPITDLQQTTGQSDTSSSDSSSDSSGSSGSSESDESSGSGFTVRIRNIDYGNY